MVKYDGYDFELFRKSMVKGTGLGSNRIAALIEDHSGNIWISSHLGGISIWMSETNQIVPVKLSGDSDIFIKSFCHGLTWGSENVLWLGTDHGLFELNTDSLTVKRHLSGVVYAILKGPGMTLWLGTDKGLIRFDAGAGTQVNINAFCKLDDTNYYQITALEYAPDSNIWIGALTGLYKFDTGNNIRIDCSHLSGLPVKEILTSGETSWIAGESGLIQILDGKNEAVIYPFQECNPGGLGFEGIEYLIEDNEGLIWVGTYNGIRLFNPFRGNIFDPFMFPCDHPSLKRIRMIENDRDGNLWVAGEDSCLYLLDSDYHIQKFCLDSKEDILAIRDIWDYDSAHIWLATSRGILPFYIPGKRFLYEQMLNSKFDSLNTPKEGNNNFYTDIFDFEEDIYGNLWIATQKKGLFIWDNKMHRLYHPKATKKLIIDDIVMDNNGQMWLVTLNEGILQANLGVGGKNAISIKKISALFPEAQMLENKAIICMHFSDSSLWIGSRLDGLFQLTFDGILHSYAEPTLPNNTIYAIAENNSFLWLSTNMGLVRIQKDNPADYALYNIHDGLSTNEFNSRVFHQMEDGMFAFGSINGLSLFYPDSIKYNNPIVTTTITHLSIVGRKKEDYITQNLPRELFSTNGLQIPHFQNSVYIKVSGLSYSNPQKQQFRFLLLHDADTILDSTSLTRDISLIGLRSGKYSLIIQGNTTGQKPGKTQELYFRILPEPLKSPMAIFGYIVLGLSLIFIFFRFRIRQINLLHELKHEQELKARNDNFIQTISHEFRTPITVIKFGLNALLPYSNDSKENIVRERLDRNVKRLQNMTNRILYFSKAENTDAPLSLSQVDLIYFFNRLVTDFGVFPETKIGLENNYPLTNVVFDEELILSVFEELLVNAYHNRNQHRPLEITLTLKEVTERKRNFLKVEVCDNGRGIPTNLIDDIFNEFVFDPSPDAKKNGGLGLGLAIVKDILRRHEGRISVQNNLQFGATFTLLIPADLQPNKVGYALFSSKELKPHFLPEKEPETEMKLNLPKILIVDDEPDVRESLKNLFEDSYVVLQAENRRKGIDIARQRHPDLIISDVIMQGKDDGVILAKELKENEETKFIPVILFSVRTDEEVLIGSYRNLVDSYVPKSADTNPELLKLKAQSLIEIRKLYQKLEEEKFCFSMETKKILNSQHPLIKKMLTLLFQKLNSGVEPGKNPFSVEMIAEELGMKRSGFHERIKAIIGIPPKDLIDRLRAEHAASLLVNTDKSMGEIAEIIGYNSESSLTNLFKNKFNMTPFEFQKAHRR